MLRTWTCPDPVVLEFLVLVLVFVFMEKLFSPVEYKSSGREWPSLMTLTARYRYVFCLQTTMDMLASASLDRLPHGVFYLQGTN